MGPGEDVGDAEVGQLDRAETVDVRGLRRAQQVGRFEVAVDDASVVGVLQSRRYLQGKVENFFPR